MGHKNVFASQQTPHGAHKTLGREPKEKHYTNSLLVYPGYVPGCKWLFFMRTLEILLWLILQDYTLLTDMSSY